MKILVVDDSTVVRLMLRRTLESIGHESIEAVDGKQALAMLDQHKDIKLALVDLNMPVMNGLEFITEARSRPEYKDFPMLIVTTEPFKPSIEKAIGAGANDFLNKPFESSSLKEKIEKLGAR